MLCIWQTYKKKLRNVKARCKWLRLLKFLCCLHPAVAVEAENCTAHKSKRILSYLSQQALEQGHMPVTIPFSRQQLADYLGVDRSALSNELSKMQKDGILRVDRNTFWLLKEAGMIEK